MCVLRATGYEAIALGHYYPGLARGFNNPPSECQVRGDDEKCWCVQVIKRHNKIQIEQRPTSIPRVLPAPKECTYLTPPHRISFNAAINLSARFAHGTPTGFL